MICPNSDAHAPDEPISMAAEGITYLDGGGPFHRWLCRECGADLYIPE